MVVLVVLGFASAQAGEIETWLGGHVTTGVQVQGSDVGTILSQAEVDFRAATGPFALRLDLDYHVDPYVFRGDNSEFTLAPHYPLPPEYAYLQIGRDAYVRLGVTNPAMGIQEWDEKDNYLPTYTNAWSLTNAQNLGVEPGIVLGDGTNLWAFGGYDMGWATWGTGAGITKEGEVGSTWTGFFVLPTEGYGMIISANELYPHDLLWLTAEVDAGIGPDGGKLVAGHLIAQLLPDAAYGGALRVEGAWMNDAAVDYTEFPMDTLTLTGGLRADPLAWLHLAADARLAWPRGGEKPYVGATLLTTFIVPGEPEDPTLPRDPEE